MGYLVVVFYNVKKFNDFVYFKNIYMYMKKNVNKVIE